MSEPLPKSITGYVLQALMPYTSANLKLSFKPNQFFNDLEKISKSKKRSLQTAYYRAQKVGLIELDQENIPRLTPKGQLTVRRYQAQKLKNDVTLLVIFDIPEDESWKRQRLRRLLRELKFKQIQKSVWSSDFDYREILLREIDEYDLRKYLQIYESARIYPGQ